MQQERLVLKDGTVIENGKASRLKDQLYLTIPGNDLPGAAVTFSDLNKTETITAYYSVYKKTFHGFTTLYSVQYFQDQDQIQIWLKGEDVSDESEYTVPEEYLPKSMRTKKENENNGPDDNT